MTPSVPLRVSYSCSLLFNTGLIIMNIVRKLYLSNMVINGLGHYALSFLKAGEPR